MKSQSKALAIGVATALASILAPATASATGVCYEFNEPGMGILTETVDGIPPLVLRYRASKVGALTTDTEARRHYHLKQDAYSLVGKVTTILARCDAAAVEHCSMNVQPIDQVRLMTTADGTIITGQRFTGKELDAPGAHMGVNIHVLRRIPELAGEVPIGPAVLECTTSQVSATPEWWRCLFRADINFEVGGGYFLPIALIEPFILERVNPLSNPGCSVFQDGRPHVPVF